MDWPRGEKLTDIPRFTVGTASATVAVAKPTAQLSATTAQVDCGGSLNPTGHRQTRQRLKSVEAVGSSWTGYESIEPKQTTTYFLTATCLGGIVTSTATANFNHAVQANLQLAPAEVHYKRIGDKVVQDDNTALNWSAANASSVSIDGLGTVDATGSRSLQPAPKKTDAGPVDENVTYTLTASNGCGGTETRTAVLHIVGDIEQPETQLTMRSVYFPSNRPRSIKSEAALLPSEREALQSIAVAFKTYLTVKPDAHLMLSGHADKRGPTGYNQALSEKAGGAGQAFSDRAGKSRGKPQTHAYGKGQNLTVAQVKELLRRIRF